MKNSIRIALGLLLTIATMFQVKAQESLIATEVSRQDLDLALSAQENGFLGSLAYQRTRMLGRQGQWRLSYGIRYSNFRGRNLEFYSAPVDFYGIEEKTDTLFAASPSQNNIALYLGASYNSSGLAEVGFNIDALGYTFGQKTDATFFGSGQQIITTASPNQPTVLLVGARDIGMIKAEFFAAFHLTDTWTLRFCFNNNFLEYKTATELQKGNTRFRADPTMGCVALRYKL